MTKGALDVIRTAWAERLQFAATATLSDLIVANAQVTGLIEDDLGSITDDDADALASVGLPTVKGWLYPSIERASTSQHRCVLAFVLGTHDTGEELFAEDVAPEHFFIASVLSGNVLMVSDAYSGYTQYVNASISRFVETAWRYHHIGSVLFEMQHSGTDEVPFASREEERAIKAAAWRCVRDIDPTIGEDDKKTFWWQAIWSYL